MLPGDLLTNLPMPDEFMKQAEKLLGKDEKAMFALVGDLDLKGKYGKSAIIVTDKNIYCFDKYHDASVLTLKISDITKSKVKRMYGNAILKVTVGEKVYEAFRFTYSIASLADAVAVYLEEVAGGKNAEKEFEAVEATFDKLKLYCPKCGRALSSQGSECINCASKGKLVKKLSKYIMPEKKTLFFCLILSTITTTMALAPPYLQKILLDDVLNNAEATVDKKYTMLLTIVFSLTLIYLVQYTIGALRGHLMRVVGDKTVTRLRNDIFAKAQFLPMSFYDKTSTGSVITRVSSDTNTLQAFMLRITQEAIVQFFMMIGIIVIMFVMNWRLTLWSLIPIPVVVTGARFFGIRISPIYRRIWRRWSAVSSILSDALPGIRVIKSFTSEDRSIDKFENYNNEWLKEDMRASVIANIFPHAITFIVICGSLLIWLIGGRQVIFGTGLTTGTLISFLNYAGMFYGPINFFASMNDSYQHAMTSTERILDIIDAEPEPNFGKGNNVDRLEGKIEFKNVNFSFDKTKKTLSNINVVIEPGDIVGIVGTTGSGKSTLVNLLMRFYDNYEGEILVDGMNIKDIDLQSFRAKIGYVQQEPLMFRDTIFKNIAYSCPDSAVEEVIHAADVANAHGFIAKLPDGYDTMLGERGTGLSGGERQRLSIARAVLKNPSMLIFDEATAAVDSETEHLIQEAIERLISGRTTLMIAHRLSTLRKANKIIVVDKGEIIEFGSHDELMALEGKYFKLIEIQSLSEKIRKNKEEENFE